MSIYDEPNEDKWLSYESEEGDILVYPKCPNCGQYVAHGEVKENLATGEVKLTGWNCARCGEIQPHYTRD